MEGVGLYGIISICIFFGFFIGMLLWAARLKRNYIESMQALPLDEDNDSPSEPTKNYE